MMLGFTVILMIAFVGFGCYHGYYASKSERGSDERESEIKMCVGAFCFAFIAMGMLPVTAALW